MLLGFFKTLDETAPTQQDMYSLIKSNPGIKWFSRLNDLLINDLLINDLLINDLLINDLLINYVLINDLLINDLLIKE